MSLSQMQIERLNQLPASKIVEYIDKGQVSYPFPIYNPEKKNEVERILANRPNPAEQKEWMTIEQEYNVSSPTEYYKRLSNYFVRWEKTQPIGNHLEECKRRMAEIEDSEWGNVNKFSESELLKYLKMYPNSVHRDEIDDKIWNIAKNEYNIKDACKRYLMNFSSGRHIEEAREIIEACGSWDPIHKDDIFAVKKYLNDYPESPFRSDVINILESLKNEQLAKMKANPAGFNRNLLLRLISEDIFSKNELCHKGITTNWALDLLDKYESIHLPNLSDSIQGGECTTDSNHTDIFLFGIPSTGKTCVLMGLVRSPKLYYNSQLSGGRYADDLVQWVTAGMTPDRTPAVVTTIDAKIKSDKGDNLINLVEMSGEEFATRLAINQNNDVNLEDMGEGAPALLSNNNKKAFYFIVDPTVETITFTKAVPIYADKLDENGNLILNEYGEPERVVSDYEEITYSVDQELTLKKMVDLLFLPKHRNIMRNVKSINFIVTKADTLGDSKQEQITRAMEIIRSHYSHIIQAIVDNRKEMGYVFNNTTKGIPKMYTFSLGHFYPGGIYKYVSEDADLLIDAFKGGTVIIKKKTFWDKFQDAVN